MNRPAARNALSGPMLELKAPGLGHGRRRSCIRACVLTGRAGRSRRRDLKAMTRSHPGDQFRGGGNGPVRIESLLKGRRLTSR